VSSTNSRLVYLDLNHWYALGDALVGQPQRPEHVDILNVLTDLVNQGKLLFPLSSVHYIELAENPRDQQRERATNAMVLLSRFRTIVCMSKLVDEELALALNKRFGRPAFPVKIKKFGFGVSFALTGKLEGFRITGGTDKNRKDWEANLGCPIADLEKEINSFAEYEMLKQPPKDSWARIPGYNPYAARGVADRELKSFNVMLNTLRTDANVRGRPLDAICARQFYFEIEDNWIRALLDAGYSANRPPPLRGREVLTEFLMPMPSRRVATMMQFYYLKDLKRDWTVNDLRDIAALAAAIPYCNIVVTDKKAWDCAANRAGLDKEFGTKILCQLTDLVAQL
jgi:hypothetical protein